MAKILYIEDTENNRILITRWLGQNGYEVLTAENAEKGVALAREKQPDLILMDMGLPEVDGWSATRQLRKDPQAGHIPVIALTAHVMHGDREKALAAGCDDYDTKPFQFTRLLGKIENLLANPRPRGPRSEESSPPEDSTAPFSLKDQIAQARHDLCNPLGNILGLCEIHLHPDQPPQWSEARAALETIDKSASQMVRSLKLVLDPERMAANAPELKSLREQLHDHASRILQFNQRLAEHANGPADRLFREDLARMRSSAQRLADMIDSTLSFG